MAPPVPPTSDRKRRCERRKLENLCAERSLDQIWLNQKVRTDGNTNLSREWMGTFNLSFQCKGVVRALTFACAWTFFAVNDLLRGGIRPSDLPMGWTCHLWWGTIGYRSTCYDVLPHACNTCGSTSKRWDGTPSRTAAQRWHLTFLVFINFPCGFICALPSLRTPSSR